MKSPRLLVLTAGFGEGHNAAARAIAGAYDEKIGANASRVVDLFALAQPRFNAWVRPAYLQLINRAPRLWSGIYAWMDRSDPFPAALGLLSSQMRVLRRILAEDPPALVCSTYPVYGFMLEKLRETGLLHAPAFTIVTDSISINSLWWKAEAAGWFVPNPDSAETMCRAGVSSDRVHSLGFPVSKEFIQGARRLAPPPLTCDLQEKPPAAPRVLFLINSGTRGAFETARLLLAEEEWDVTCAVGRDEALLKSLVQLAKGRRRPAKFYGWTDQIPHLLMTHHVVVSKAGGATTQEAIAARCPMVVNQIIPGQEEGNYELLRRHGIGAYAETPQAIVRELRAAFADDARIWQRWCAAVSEISKPDAARQIVDFISAHLSTVNERSVPPAKPLYAASLSTHA